MKVFILKQEDIDRLLLMIDRNPEHGVRGGSSQPMDPLEAHAHREAHGFFNYQVRTWVSEVTS